jgi:hypothetical protein
VTPGWFRSGIGLNFSIPPMPSSRAISEFFEFDRIEASRILAGFQIQHFRIGFVLMAGTAQRLYVLFLPEQHRVSDMWGDVIDV